MTRTANGKIARPPRHIREELNYLTDRLALPREREAFKQARQAMRPDRFPAQTAPAANRKNKPNQGESSLIKVNQGQKNIAPPDAIAAFAARCSAQGRRAAKRLSCSPDR